jgi:hypothetical protein
MSDDFEGIALVNEEGLAFGGIVHLLGILRDERVKERIKTFIVSAFGSEDAAKTLRFLTPGSIMRGYLDKTSCFGQVERGVTNFGEK